MVRAHTQAGQADVPANPADVGLLGLPLAFVALPLYVLLPEHYARSFGVPLATLGLLLLGARVADALLQMEKAHARDQEARGERAGEFDYLSTHPATAARIARARAAAGASKGQ